MTKIALITGASRGLGAALAEALAPEHHIVAAARTVGGLEELDDRIKARGGAATLAPMDLSDAEEIARLAGGLQDRWGKIDLWAHTAIHAPPLSPAGHIDHKHWDKAVALNVKATAALIRLIEPLLLAADAGRALFFEDDRGGEKFFAAYGGTKAAQIAMARSWQAETAKIGPKVDILTPEPMTTATRGRFFPGEDRSKLSPPRAVAETVVAAL